ncbi:hypothetical protein KOR34_07690 [Posidoniimonas corsicana]|uniref:SF3 helicase domain-containing protein n=1 Tax=Posidoniimonas corsicana TaxID=1938618 RepID=A0A5C5VD11_9BACT|nr:phage/plasmid primase, P4 family [Posidoniimonas corsicana]TWT35873.1 hypothetical protein KOR34_07690 [Posidoniimonas corsicana]
MTSLSANANGSVNGILNATGDLRKLTPAHLQELAASGISEETAEAAGIYSEHERIKLALMMGWKSWPQKYGAALVFPYRDLEGNVLFSRVKPERPPQRNGKTAKYLQPRGVKSHAYFPPGVAERFAENKVDVWVTEGEKKALCASQNGLPTIGLSGVWNWQPKGKVSQLLPELNAIEWRGRKVFIAFDSDAVEKSNVLAAEQMLASAMQARGAVVKVARIPGGPDGAKWGLDDMIVALGSDAITQLINDATDPEEVDPGSLKTDASDMDAAIEADAIVREMTEDGVSRLRFWHGTWWLWKAGCYTPRRDDEVRAEIVNRLNHDFMGVKPAHVNEVLEHLRAKTILSSATEAPAWLVGADGDPDPGQCVALRNGLLSLPTLFGGGESLRPATPRLLATAACDYDFQLDAPRPDAWLAFLQSVWGDDQSSIAALQELMGYLLTADTSQQKIFLLIGPTRSGKGAIARVIHRLVGKGNTCGPTLAGMATNFGLASLIGKSVAVISDARLSGRTDQSVVLERLLSISGEDTLSIDVKFKEAIQAKLPTRLVILSNELPRLADASSAITGRFLVLRMTKSFLGKEDRGLDAKLASELPSIFLWACEGWRRLNERGYFQQPDSALELLSEMRDLASPTAAFVSEQCEVGAGFQIPVKELYGAWCTWCRSQGRDHTETAQMFGRNLQAAVPGVIVRQPRINGAKVRAYEGIKLCGQY